MSTAAKVDPVIESLPASEYAQLLVWLDERRAAQADAQCAAAVLSGEFDALAQRAEREVAAGDIVPLDEFLRERP